MYQESMGSKERFLTNEQNTTTPNIMFAKRWANVRNLDFCTFYKLCA